MDKSKQYEHHDGNYMPFDSMGDNWSISIWLLVCHVTNMTSNGPLHNQEDSLERDIEHLERRLSAAKAQFMLIACQKK
jgi:hypothetical protein